LGLLGYYFNHIPKFILLPDEHKFEIIKKITEDKPTLISIGDEVYIIYNKTGKKPEKNKPKVRIVKAEKKDVLGCGAFGVVFSGTVMSKGDYDDRQKAIKVFYNKHPLFTPENTVKNYDILCQGQKISGIIPRQLLVGSSVLMGRKYDCNVDQYIENQIYDRQKIEDVTTEFLLSYLKDCFEGLECMHSRGFCHMDITKNNIYIRNDRFIIADTDSLANKYAKYINYFFMSSPSHTFIKDRTDFLIFLFNEAKKIGINIWEEPTDRDSPPSEEQINLQASLVEFRQKMDVAGLGFGLICLMLNNYADMLFIKMSSKEFSEISQELQLLMRINIKEWESLYVGEKMSLSALRDIEKCRKLHGSEIVDLILDMLKPHAERITAKEALKRCKTIIENKNL